MTEEEEDKKPKIPPGTEIMPPGAVGRDKHGMPIDSEGFPLRQNGVRYDITTSPHGRKGNNPPPVHTRFRKGDPRVGRGRKKGSSILTPFRRKLAANKNEFGEGEAAERMADEWIKICSGEIPPEQAGPQLRAIQDAVTRMDGAVTKRTESTVTTIQVTAILQDFMLVVRAHAPDNYEAILADCRAKLAALPQASGGDLVVDSLETLPERVVEPED